MNNTDEFFAPPRFASNECSELNEVSRLNDDWRTNYQQLGAGLFETWFDLYTSSGLRLSDQYCSREMSVSGIPPPDHVALALTVNRGKKGVFQGCEFGIHDVGLMAADSETLFRSPEKLRMMVVTIPVSRFSSALCAAAYGKEFCHLIAETPVISLHNSAFVSLARAIRRALDIAQSAPQSAMLAVCLREIEESVVSTLSLTLTDCARPAQGARARRNRLRYLERARAYIEAHPDSPLGMETLATVTGASIRSLETAFREILGVTPVQYIRVSRLNVAKNRLLHADCTETSVTATAQALGFSHMSRFAQDYRALFHQLPSDTLAVSA